MDRKPRANNSLFGGEKGACGEIIGMGNPWGIESRDLITVEKNESHGIVRLDLSMSW